MLSSALLLVAGFAGLGFSANSTSDVSPYASYWTDITDANQAAYCSAQENSCRDICDDVTSQNSCDSSTGAWGCTCTDFTTPNISSYSQTVPYYLCEEYVAQCQLDTTVASVQQACLAIDCGSKSPVSQLAAYSSSAAAAAASSTASTSSSTSSSATTTSSATAASTTSSSWAQPTMMALAKNYGSGVLGAGVIAAFGMAL